MCLICDRIQWILEGRNPYFVKELDTGYVVLGDHQHFEGYTLFLCKSTKQSCPSWSGLKNSAFWRRCPWWRRRRPRPSMLIR